MKRDESWPTLHAVLGETLRLGVKVWWGLQVTVACSGFMTDEPIPTWHVLNRDRGRNRTSMTHSLDTL